MLAVYMCELPGVQRGEVKAVMEIVLRRLLLAVGAVLSIFEGLRTINEGEV